MVVRAQPLLWDSAHFNSDATLLLFDLQVLPVKAGDLSLVCSCGWNRGCRIG